jgi:hypothetical protein
LSDDATEDFSADKIVYHVKTHPIKIPEETDPGIV